MNLVIATNNRHKYREITSVLSDLSLNIKPIWVYPDPPDLPEDGETYAENALSKARTVARFAKEWTLADDTGLEVAALHGAPGLYSARYAGKGASYSDNRKKLLKSLRGIPIEKRRAIFRCVMALVDPSGQERVVEGSIEGIIAEEDQGEGGFGYDPVFFLPEFGQTFAQLDPDIKNKWSHRFKALEQVRHHLETLVRGA